MKKILLAAAVVVAGIAGTALALKASEARPSGVALQDDRAPVNKTCPVMVGKPIKTAYMSVHEGRPIAFCCGKCKKLFDADPGEYAGNLPPAEAPKTPAVAQLGKPAPAFELKDTDGNVVKLADFKEQIVVLQWTDPACPASKRLATDGVESATIKKIRLSAKDKIFHFSICSAAGMKGGEFAKFLTDAKVDSKGLMDPDGKIAKLFAARTSTHAFVIDRDGTLLYSGAVDNDPDGKKGDKAINYVADAVASIVDGKKPKPDKTTPYGTAIKVAK